MNEDENMQDDAQVKYLQSLGEEKVKEILKNSLNDCLASYNQEYSFETTGIDLEKGKMQVEFNIVAIPEDNYVGFQGY